MVGGYPMTHVRVSFGKGVRALLSKSSRFYTTRVGVFLYLARQVFAVLGMLR